MTFALLATNFTKPSTLQPEHCLNHHQHQHLVNQHSTCDSQEVCLELLDNV